MGKIQALRVVEYKNLNNFYYVLVEWSDKTVSWTRLSSLKNKELLVSFIKKAVDILKQEAKSDEERIKKEEENEMLNKIFNDNLRQASRIESAQLKITEQLLKDVKTKDENMKSPLQFNKMEKNLFRVNEMSKESNLQLNSPWKDNFSSVKQDSFQRKELPFANSTQNKFNEKNTKKSSVFNEAVHFSQIKSNGLNRESVSEDFLKGKKALCMKKVNPVDDSTFFEKFHSASNLRSSTQNQNFNFNQFHNSPIENKSIKELPTIPSGKKISAKIKSNSLSVKIDQEIKIFAEFYCSADLLPIAFESKDLFFINFKSIYPYLYTLFISNNPNFGFYPSVESFTQPLNEFDEGLIKENSVIAGIFNDHLWIVFLRLDERMLFRHKINSKYLIVKAKKDSFLTDLLVESRAISISNIWSSDRFKFGIDMLTDSIFADCSLPEAKNIYIFGSKDTFNSRHLTKFAKIKGSVTENFIEADLVLIQDDYLPFLHRLPQFYESLKTKTKFFVQAETNFQEILVKGGFITFSPEFLEKVELLAVADLIEMVLRKPFWEIKVTRDLYNLLKRRLNSHSALPDYLNKMKLVYKTFKNSLVENERISLIEELEMKNFRTHRHFVEVSLFKVTEMSVSMDEAINMVLAS